MESIVSTSFNYLHRAFAGTRATPQSRWGRTRGKATWRDLRISLVAEDSHGLSSSLGDILYCISSLLNMLGWCNSLPQLEHRPWWVKNRRSQHFGHHDPKSTKPVGCKNHPATMVGTRGNTTFNSDRCYPTEVIQHGFFAHFSPLQVQFYEESCRN